MSLPNVQMRHRPPRTLNVLPNSSYIGAAGGVWDVLKDQEQGSTVTPTVWYGTVNAGLVVREKSRGYFVVEGTTGTVLPSTGGNSVTRLDSVFDEELTKIRELLSEGEILEARQRFGELPGAIRNLPVNQLLARALAVPDAGLSDVGSGHRISRQWIREHSDEYKGKWVALFNDKLLGDDESCVALRQRIGSERENMKGVQFLFVS